MELVTEGDDGDDVPQPFGSWPKGKALYSAVSRKTTGGCGSPEGGVALSMTAKSSPVLADSHSAASKTSGVVPLALHSGSEEAIEQ